MAQVDYFLKLDGVPGESTDSKHKDEIEVLSFSWGETQTGSASGGSGGGAGVVQMSDFSFTMRTSKASPLLFLKCASGEHIKEALLTLRKSGGQQLEFIKWTLSDLIISNYSIGGASEGDGHPYDQVALNFAKIEFEYTPQKPDGTADTPVRGGWDLKQNTKT
jgi:type VI secretion system secreted protein Hcp